MGNILHKIRVYLYENRMTKDDPNDLLARVARERTLSIKDICNVAVQRGGADISAAAMEHGVNLFLKEMGYQLSNGFGVNTGWFSAAAHIRGVFNSPQETFDPKKHTISFDFQQGITLRKELQNIEVEVAGLANNNPVIAQVTDVKTGSINDLLTPNRTLKITGHKLKIVGDHPEVGVYFVSCNNSTEHKVDPSEWVTNLPSELMITVPLLPEGQYHLKVVTQYGISVILKEPHAFTFDKPLTVMQ